MIRFLLGVRLVALAFAAVAVGVCALSVRKDIAEIRASATSLGVDAHEAFLQVKTLARQATVTQDMQALYLSAEQNHIRKVTLPAVDASIEQFRAAIAHTDESLNQPTQGLLPVAGNAIALDAFAVRETAEAADKTLGILVEQTEPALREGADAMHGLEQRINDPANAKIQANLAVMTLSAAETGGNVNATSADFRAWVHGKLHPKWPTKVGHWVDHGAHVLGSWVF